MTTENSSESTAKIVTHTQVISDAPGSLERLLMNLRRRRVHILHMEIDKKSDHYVVTFKAETERPHRIKPTLDRLWDVRKVESNAPLSKEVTS